MFTTLLQVVIVFIGIGAFVFLLWEPHFEGRNAHATLFEVYFNDPFLAYAYIASIAYFVALHKVFVALKYVRQGKMFSVATVKALRTIKYCAMALVGFILGAEAYFFVVRSSEDDIAGGVAMGLFLIVASALVATTAAMFERKVQHVSRNA